jgi:hypothetical protein
LTYKKRAPLRALVCPCAHKIFEMKTDWYPALILLLRRGSESRTLIVSGDSSVSSNGE